MTGNAEIAVRNALSLYAETSGMTVREVCQWFAESAACRENIYLLVALQANGPYGDQLLAQAAQTSP